MDEKSALNALGLARRAGKCITGDYAVERAIKAKRVCLVTLDLEASDATKQRYRALCERNEITYMEFEHMGRAIGKPNGKIAAIADQGFASMIKNAGSKEIG